MGPSTSARATSPLQPGRLVVLLFIACCVPFAIADPKSPPPPSTTPPPPSGTKDLFPLSPADVTLLEPVCNGKVSNDNFHPCPLHGNCAFDNQTCTTPTPYSCNSAQSADLDSCKQAYGCGKAVIIKVRVPVVYLHLDPSDLSDPGRVHPSWNPDPSDLLDPDPVL